MLLNYANMVCIHMHPSPPEDAASAWLVDEFNGKDVAADAAVRGISKV